MDIYSTKEIMNSLGLYIENVLFCIFILSIPLIKTYVRGYRISYYREFSKIIYAAIVFMFIDVGRVIAENYTNNSHWLNLASLAYFTAITITEYEMLNFFNLIIYNKDMSKRAILFCIPIILSTFFIMTFGLSSGRLTFTITFLVLSSYYIYRLLHYYRSNTKMYFNRSRFLILPIIPFIIVISHLKFPVISISMGVTLTIVIAYINCLQMLISLDSLTKINNRYSLLPYLEKKIKSIGINSDYHLYALIMDINKFKGINDTYGHVVGDECLVRLADTLKEACTILERRAYICRYGGDEFLIVVDSNKFEEIERLEKHIHEVLRYNNSKATVATDMSITIGISVYDKDKHLDIKDFINSADNCLYFRKNKTRLRGN